MIDAHAHVWSLSRGDYDWLTPELPRLYRDFTTEMLRAEMDRAGVAQAILVQAAPTVVETRWLCALADAHDWVHGVVGWLDLTLDNSLEAVMHHKLVGIRAMPEAWQGTTLDDPAFDPAFAAVAAAGLAFDALVELGDLAGLGKRMDRTPGLRVVIDHGAHPDGDPRWPEALEALAGRGAFAKLSGLVTLPHCAGETELAELVAHLVAIFPDRLMWGSDWPVVTQRCDYSAWVATARRFVPPGNAAVFTNAAAAAYRLEDRV